MTTARASVARSAAISSRVDPGALGSWVLSFALVGYLALRGGGYDVVVSSQVGIAAWWIVLVGVALAVLPQVRVNRGAGTLFALLAAFAALSAASALWSESPERAISETARVVTLLGIFALAVAAIRERHVRPLINGVFVAVAGVAILACLSRLHPAWFGDPSTAAFLPQTRSRLSYGLNYWNGVAAFMTMGLPLGLAIAMTARTALARTAATAILPVLALTGFFTFSRGGILAGSAALIVAFCLTADRGRWLTKLGLAAIGAAILVKGAVQRDALHDGLLTRLAHHQGDELLVITLVVVAGVAFVHAGLGLARAAGYLAPTSVAPRAVRAAWVAAALAVVVAVGMVVATGYASDQWQSFKHLDVVAQHNKIQRFSSTSGNGRYQYWVSSVDAFKTAPVAGIGAGSFETWWARHATVGGSVRNAHSLYFETLAELGVAGLALLVALFVLTIGMGVRRALQAPPGRRALLAGVTAACASFVVSAGVDWVWQLTVLPAAFLLLAVVLVGPPTDAAVPSRRSRAGAAVLAVVALAALAVPLAAATQLRESQRAAQANHLAPALRHAASSGRVQPYASSPQLQRALLLEASGDLSGAIAAARAAEGKEPTNWRPPFVLARLEAANGNVDAGVAALRRARALNPKAGFLR